MVPLYQLSESKPNSTAQQPNDLPNEGSLAGRFVTKPLIPKNPIAKTESVAAAAGAGSATTSAHAAATAAEFAAEVKNLTEMQDTKILEVAHVIGQYVSGPINTFDDVSKFDANAFALNHRGQLEIWRQIGREKGIPEARLQACKTNDELRDLVKIAFRAPLVQIIIQGYFKEHAGTGDLVVEDGFIAILNQRDKSPFEIAEALIKQIKYFQAAGLIRQDYATQFDQLLAELN